MSEIKAFNNDRIAESLARCELKWLRTPAGAFVVDARTDFGAVRILLNAEVDNRVLLAIITSDTSFAVECGPELLAFTNTWNCEQRFGKAFVDFVEIPQGDAAVVVFEQEIPLGNCGVHDELLDELIAAAISTALDLHRTVAASAADQPAADVAAPTAEELETWLDRSA